MKLPDTRWHIMQQFEHNRLLMRCGFFNETSNLSTLARVLPGPGFRALHFTFWHCPQLSCTLRHKLRRAVDRSLAAGCHSLPCDA